MRANVEIQASAVLEKYVGTPAPRDHSPEEISRNLVRAQPTLSPQRAGDSVFILESEDPALHIGTLPVKLPASVLRSKSGFGKELWQFLRVPRELPDRSDRGTRSLHQCIDSVPGHKANLCRSRKGSSDRSRCDVLYLTASGTYLGRHIVSDDSQSTNYQHARRTPRRRRKISTSSCHCGRLQHE